MALSKNTECHVSLITGYGVGSTAPDIYIINYIYTNFKCSAKKP